MMLGQLKEKKKDFKGQGTWGKSSRGNSLLLKILLVRIGQCRA